MKKAHNFRELLIWKESMKLVKRVYLTTSNVPSEEKFGLISQINRCAVSIPSNIAEGSGRTSEKDFLNFLRISISSSYELETQLILIQDLFDINTENVITELHTIQNMIGGFIRKLNSDG
jgi:four helix bundle protein